MKVFLVEMNDMELFENGEHGKFLELVRQNLFEYWDYFSQQYVLVTKDNIESKFILEMVLKCFGNDAYFAVFEIDIKSYAAHGPKDFMLFFEIMKYPGYIPVWERTTADPYHFSNIMNMKGIPYHLKQRLLKI